MLAPETSRGKIRKRTWVYDGKKRTAFEFSILVYENGRRRRVRRQFPTRAEAEAALDAFKDDLKREPEQPAPGADLTLDAYADRWVEQVSVALHERTLASYRQMLRLYIRPALGGLRLRELQRPHVKELLAKKREAGLGKNTLRLIRATLSVMLGDAVEDGLIPINPAAGIGRGRRKRADALTQAERRQNIRPLSYEQLAAFLAVAERGRATDGPERRRGRRDYVLFLTLADAGLRPGEALALQWDDVDLVDRSLRVARAVSAGGVKDTKTGETRHVDLTARLADALGRWQAECEAEALATGCEPSPWVFPSEAGTPLDEAKVAKRFRGLLHRARLPRFRLYDLRHSFATHLLAEGAPITYVAAQLGHAKPTTTLAFYAHWLPRGDKAFIDRLESARQTKPSMLAQEWRKNSEALEPDLVTA